MATLRGKGWQLDLRSGYGVAPDSDKRGSYVVQALGKR